MKYFQIDAFTDRVFAGDPAGVVPLDEWLPDEAMLAIAAENKLSETAFFVPLGKGEQDFALRWFTPEVEVQLCGHATLASAHVLFEHLAFAGDTIRFSTVFSGSLSTSRDGGSISLDFPARGHEQVELETPLVRALGRQPARVYRSLYNLLCVFDNKREVLEIEPDSEAIKALDAFGVIATAPGTRHDFVSRYFAPNAGVDEDPVTGSAHCTLAPFWAAHLGKHRLTAHQVSKRGGEMICEVDGDRVRLIGRAVTYLEGQIQPGEPLSRNGKKKATGAAGIGTVLIVVVIYLLLGPSAFDSTTPSGEGSGTSEATARERAAAPGASSGVASGMDPALRSAINGKQSKVMVSLNARVVKVLPDDNEGSRHQRLLLALDRAVDGVDTVLIAHNIDLAERVPCSEGERLLVRGQYEWNDRGGVIHWTHHDPRGRREGGWIEHNGVRYE